MKNMPSKGNFNSFIRAYVVVLEVKEIRVKSKKSDFFIVLSLTKSKRT
jgi:hypothetical protein